jgi:alpha-beta hydrolase superfamily lysophospholipase
MEKVIQLVDPYENNLHTVIWKYSGNKKPKGIVQIIHGKGEHIERYKEFAEYLNDQGFVVIGNDHLGHGSTSETKEYSHFDDELGFHKVYGGVMVVRNYIEETWPDIPVIMVAHSMGSFIGRYAMLYDHKRYNMAIFTGTAWTNSFAIRSMLLLGNIIQKIKGPKHISPLFTYLSDKAPRSMIKNGIINSREEWISADRDIIKASKNDPLSHYPFTISAQLDVLRFIKETQNQAKIEQSASSSGIFFISGEFDALGNYGLSVTKLFKLYRSAGYSNVKYSVVNGARHEVLNEVDRKDTYAMILDWIQENL